jgi:ferredoxin
LSIKGEKKAPHVLSRQHCIKCGACYDVCRYDAVVIRAVTDPLPVVEA